MAGSSTDAISVSAKVILAETKVPSLSGGVFNRDAVLEEGIHVHWALPDYMTRAILLPKGGDNIVIFPGVPDLWLVIRFNPGPPIEQVDAKRTWRAWVVDSIAETWVPLSSWVPPSSRDPKLVHTAAGILPSAGRIGYPGYGIGTKDLKDYDPAMAAYYPESRRRFGFHDTVKDLSGTGAVSYAVIGWFADRGYDPLYLAGDKLGLVNYRKTSHHLRSDVFDEMCTAVPMQGGIVKQPAFEVSSIGVADLSLAPGKELDFINAGAKGGTQEWMSLKTDAMSESCPAASAEKLDVAASSAGPTYTILHGYVFEVPLQGPTTIPGDIGDKDIRLFPSVRRAMAELTAMRVDKPDHIDALELMLDDLESMKNSLAGILDMPGMAHTATFQSVPGKSQWYARIEIQPKDPVWEAVSAFDVGMVPISSGYEATGHWPKLMVRSASNKQDWMTQSYPPTSIVEPALAEAEIPSEGHLNTWSEGIKDAFTETSNAAAAAGKPIDPNLVNVIDRRKDAQPSMIGTAAGRGGSDGAGWWIDLSDPLAIPELLRSAAGGKVVLPTVDNLLEVPGPRWNRPWSPQLVLFGTGRSFKFGCDNRFRSDGYMKTRQSGETTTALAVGSNATVFGRDILDNPSGLFSTPGLPSEARGLVNEALLFDTESASVMARLGAGGRGAGKEALAAAQQQMKSAIRGLWLSRDQKMVSAKKPNLAAVTNYGTFPSDVAISPWQNPRDPLFVDVNYSHPHSSMTADWTLDQDCVEMKSKGTQGTNPPSVEVMEERTRVTASVITVLKSALVTNKTLDLSGQPNLKQKPPKDVTETTFDEMDVISAPLTSLDSTLMSRDYRERSGALRVNRLELVDIFGLTREWTSGIDPASPEGDAKLSYWTELAPRIPGWARLKFRFQQANAPDLEANPLAHPVCGILVPDFVEHALEVFDGDGKALGQLTTDRPRFGTGKNPAEISLQTKFELHPWYAAERNLAPGSDLAGIDNPALKALVESLTVQGIVIPVNAKKDDWYETGMSAMLRSIDTVRATLDPSKVTDDKRIKLLGEPILVLAARLSYQATASTNPTEIAHDPPLLDPPPAMPALTVRIGDSTRPDDGVLGCFIDAKTPQGNSIPVDGRFAPVNKEAAAKAILNGLSMGIAFLVGPGLAVTHPFVVDQESIFKVEANTDKDLVILADPRGGLYATCGALPRKKITMPKEFLQASINHLEPTFRVGPIFTTKVMGQVKALAPPPEIEGLDVEYVYREPGENAGAETFPETPVPPLPPVGELPNGRAVLSEGWMRVFKPEET